jgi:hypothetical protein
MHARTEFTALTVILKLSASEAAKAAEARGIHFAFIRENRLSAGPLEAIGYTSAEYEPAVRRWFHEPRSHCLWFGVWSGARAA